MGNEGSVPEGHETDDDFEHQARAPPSYSNPPQTTNQSSRPGGRMINALRRDKSKQNNPGESVGSYPVASYPMNGDGVFSAGEDQVTVNQEQSQDYYQQQETYQIQQRTQTIPNQYYPQHGGHQQQHPLTPAPQTTLPSQSEAESTHQSPTRVKKGGMNFRSTGRGAAIINSMKNLSLSSAIQKATEKTKSGKVAGGEVNDWETKWDEDDDDESDDDEENENHSTMPLHPQMRQPATISTDTPQPMDPTLVQTQQQKAHLVTATPESDSHPSQHGPNAHGATWDTAIIHEGKTEDKPNVQMFLPLLRVLGKGSFGKVSFIVCCCFTMLF
jgi:hypothetical protein